MTGRLSVGKTLVPAFTLRAQIAMKGLLYPSPANTGFSRVSTPSMPTMQKIQKRKRKSQDEPGIASKRPRKNEEEAGGESSGDEPLASSFTAKPVVGTVSKVKVRKEAKGTKGRNMKKPTYIDTLSPKEQLLQQTVDGASIYRISDKFEVEESEYKHKGQVTEYNLTQMKWRWITTMLNKLQPVLQQPKMTTRAHKKTLFHSISEANKPMPEKEEEDEDAKNEIGWEKTWYNEPIYEMLIVKDMFANTDLILVQLSSTHGDLIVRVDKSSEQWIKFVNWLEIDQANLRGLRGKKAGEYNGFEATERMDEDTTQELFDELEKANGVCEEHNCVAVWRTKPQVH